MANDDLDIMTAAQLQSEKARCERIRTDLIEKLHRLPAAGDREALGELRRLAQRIAIIEQLLNKKKYRI